MVNDAQNEFNGSGKLVSITRDTLDLVDRTTKAQIDELLKTLNKDFKDVSHVSILFSNATRDQSNPTGPFRVIGIFDSLMGLSVAQCALKLRQDTPWVTLRVLELFEGDFQNFIEYPPYEAAASD